MNIYVGNLSFTTAESDIKEAFQAFGEVSSCNIIKDKFSGESRGFGFVEMPNGKDLKGRTAKVNEAKPRTDSSRSGGFGGGRRY